MTISADTQITELAVNDHACLTFGEAEELLDLTAAFVRDGLDGGLKVVWLSDATPDRATAELARRGIDGGVRAGLGAAGRGRLRGAAAGRSGVQRGRGDDLAGAARWPGLRATRACGWRWT